MGSDLFWGQLGNRGSKPTHSRLLEFHDNRLSRSVKRSQPTMKKCHACNAANPDGQKYCAGCGGELDRGLAEFLSSHGLQEHLEIFRQNDLFDVSDLLALGDADLRELRIPYGDIVRLRSAMEIFRQPERVQVDEDRPSGPSPLPQTETVPRPVATTAPPETSKSSLGKIVGAVVGVVVLLVIIGALSSEDPNKPDEGLPQDEPVSSSGEADLARQEALERAQQAEQELAALREQAAQAEKEKAEAQRIAAEQEAERLREAAREAERQKQEALERAAQAEISAQQRANEAEQEMARLRNQAAQATTQQQAAPALDGLDAFFQSYINSLASNNQWEVANHYANSVEYGYAKSKSGRASRSEIAEDNRKLFASYPQRSYSNIEVKQVIPLSPNVARINYGFDYQYNGKKLAMGSTDVWATVENIGGRWQITSWREEVQRVR
jgi:hypothetical protein